MDLGPGALEARVELGGIDDPVVVDDAQAMRVDIFDADWQHALRCRTQVGLVLTGPTIQTGHKRRDERTELPSLAARPLLRACRNPIGPHPAVGIEVRLAVELGSSPTCL